MGKSRKAAYVVFRGHQTGVFRSWDECEPLVNGYPKAKFQGYATLAEANRDWEKWTESIRLKREEMEERENKVRQEKEKESLDRNLQQQFTITPNRAPLTPLTPNIKRLRPYAGHDVADTVQEPDFKKPKIESPGFSDPRIQDYSSVKSGRPDTHSSTAPYAAPSQYVHMPRSSPGSFSENQPYQASRFSGGMESRNSAAPSANQSTSNTNMYQGGLDRDEEEPVTKEVKVTLTQAQQAVVELAVEKQQNIFLTGAAGSGKSATLREILRRLRVKYDRADSKSGSKYSSVQVVAPTGIAALPLGGRTIHSFARWYVLDGCHETP